LHIIQKEEWEYCMDTISIPFHFSGEGCVVAEDFLGDFQCGFRIEQAEKLQIRGSGGRRASYRE
jgi:hypothetical protein